MLSGPFADRELDVNVPCSYQLARIERDYGKRVVISVVHYQPENSTLTYMKEIHIQFPENEDMVSYIIKGDPARLYKEEDATLTDITNTLPLTNQSVSDNDHEKFSAKVVPISNSNSNYIVFEMALFKLYFDGNKMFKLEICDIECLKNSVCWITTPQRLYEVDQEATPWKSLQDGPMNQELGIETNPSCRDSDTYGGPGN